MTDLAQFDRLFARWQDLRENGESPSAAEVCADCPELTGEFQRRLRDMEALSAFLGIGSAAEQQPASGETSEETDGDTGAYVSDSVFTDPRQGDAHRVAELVRVPTAATGDDSTSHEVSYTPANHPGGAVASQLFLDPPDAPDCLGRLGPYRVLAVLGEGGMGIVLKAEEPLPRRLVAIKVVRPDLSTPHWRQRFLREGQALASVEHERVVAVYRVDEIRGMPYLVMPLLQGESLRDWLLARSGTAGPPAPEAKGDLRRSPHGPPLAEVLRIGREVAEGLAAAHAAGLIHRDIKPSNIWLRGPDRRVVLIDFGLARTPLGQHEDQTELTSAGAVLGTAGYIAPEQAAGTAVDARADLFSLGCVLYELTTGRRPFTGSSPIALLSALANLEPPSPRDLRPDVPAALSALIMRLLAKSPDDRPQSASEVVATLRSIEHGRDDLAPTAELPMARGVGVPPDELCGVGVPPAGGSTIGSPSTTTGRTDAAPASSRTFKLMVGCGGLLTVSITATAAVALITWMGQPASYRQVALHTPDQNETQRRREAPNPSRSAIPNDTPIVQPLPSPPLQEHMPPNVAPPSQPAPALPVPDSDLAPLSVLSIDVRHYARSGDDKAEPKGILGKQSFAPRVGDQVTIEARLSRPAHAYLLACRPDGTVELCFPDDESQPPPLTDSPCYPPPSQSDKRYGLAEGEGLWVFAVVASERPLPSYRDFISAHAPVWSPRAANPGVVWWYDGQTIEALFAGGQAPHTRAKGEQALGASAAMTETANWLTTASGGEAAAAIGFAVGPGP